MNFRLPNLLLSRRTVAFAGYFSLLALPARAQAPAPVFNSGDTAWVLASAALVMLMTPGLGLFYGGMVRRKNVLGTILQSLIMVALIGVQWVVFGYRLAFSPGNEWFGGLSWAWLNHLTPFADAAPTCGIPRP